MRRLVPLAGHVVAGGGPGAGAPGKEQVGVKAARLGAALRAGLPVLPGWVVPVGEGKGAMGAGVAAIRANGVAAGRMAVLSVALDAALVEELRSVVDVLGGRVIVRSSSPLEGDPRWAGAFSSVTGVTREDVASAVRSCWASAFAVDPLRRLEGCGLGLEALELAVLVQPEILPGAGGVARAWGGARADVVRADVARASAARAGVARAGVARAGVARAGVARAGVARAEAGSVTVEGVRGHPGALLSGWAEAEQLDPEVVADVVELALQVYAELGDDLIEWAECDGTVWLLQSLRSRSGDGQLAGAMPATATPATAESATAMPAMAESATAMPTDSHRVAGRPAAPGIAAGPLVACRPHETRAKDCRGAIVLVDRPVPALAPLLFGARGVIARAGAASSHLAEVARSLGIPMVVGCRAETTTGPRPAPGAWFATINGVTGEVVLIPA